jgi:hypothetical protein
MSDSWSYTRLKFIESGYKISEKRSFSVRYTIISLITFDKQSNKHLKKIMMYDAISYALR